MTNHSPNPGKFFEELDTEPTVVVVKSWHAAAVLGLTWINSISIGKVISSQKSEFPCVGHCRLFLSTDPVCLICNRVLRLLMLHVLRRRFRCLLFVNGFAYPLDWSLQLIDSPSDDRLLHPLWFFPVSFLVSRLKPQWIFTIYQHLSPFLFLGETIPNRIYFILMIRFQIV